MLQDFVERVVSLVHGLQVNRVDLLLDIIRPSYLWLIVLMNDVQRVLLRLLVLVSVQVPGPEAQRLTSFILALFLHRLLRVQQLHQLVLVLAVPSALVVLQRSQRVLKGRAEAGQ